MKRSIAVIMTVHNRRETTLKCLEHFYGCRGIVSYEVDFYMMNDGCTDGTEEAVLRKYPQVIVLKGNGNLFWNRGMYECWKEAIKKYHDYYLWLNDDTMLFPDAIEIMFDDYKTAGTLSIISGTCCDTATRSITTYGGRGEDGQLIQLTGKIKQSEAINGNVVLIPNEVVVKIGIIDPFFLHSAGDNEYSMRAKKQNIPSYITSRFVATCDRHDCQMKSEDAGYSLFQRLHFLNTPWGAMPMEKFYLYRKYKGFWLATRVLLKAYYRCLFPIKKH